METTLHTPQSQPDNSQYQKMGIFKRSFMLIKMCLQTLKHDKEMMVFPLLSGLGVIIISILFTGIYLTVEGLHAPASNKLTTMGYIVLFLYYFLNSFVVIFFNSALVSCAIKRFNGGNPTVSYGLNQAKQRVGKIFIYSLIAATVGLLLRVVAERVNALGKIIIGFIGISWSLMVFFIAPVLVMEDLSVVQSIKRSGAIFRKTWGENFIGSGGMGIIFGLLIFILAIPLIIGVIYIFSNFGVAAGFAGVAGAIILMLLLIIFYSTLSSIYTAALYHYACEKNAPSEFNTGILQHAFKQK